MEGRENSQNTFMPTNCGRCMCTIVLVNISPYLDFRWPRVLLVAIYCSLCVEMQAFNEAVHQFGYTLLCLVTFECNVFKLCSSDCWFLGTLLCFHCTNRIYITGSFLCVHKSHVQVFLHAAVWWGNGDIMTKLLCYGTWVWGYHCPNF